MARVLLVHGAKNFKITIPDDAKVTFGPFSPPSSRKGEQWQHVDKRGTLRVYEGKSERGNVLAVYSNVDGFRDLSLGYAEEVTREEGAVIWKDDEQGYMREDKVNRRREWVTKEIQGEVEAPKRRKR